MNLGDGNCLVAIAFHSRAPAFVVIESRAADRQTRDRSKKERVMHDEVEEKVGYRCPPRSGRIKKGERRNPNGRRGNKPARVTESDADILARLDAELIDFNGERITRREAGLRVLHAKAMKGDSRAILERERIRNADRQEKTVKRGGVLLLPSPVPLDEWEAASARQQAQYRERDDERIE